MAVIVIIGIVVSGGFLIAALFKHSKKILKRMLIPISVTILLCVLVIGIFLCLDEHGKNEFDNCFSEDNIVVKTADVNNTFNNLYKFGYTFNAINEGQTVIAVLEHDCGRLNYVDFYTVTVNENLEITLDKSEHFDIDGSETLKEVVPEEYEFVNRE